MRVTWLFGNGLDLSFGLKTSYNSFYAYLIDKDLQDNIIFSQLKKDFDNHKEYLWSDYEIRLGQLTSNISEDQLDKFKENKIELDLLLKEYLNTENQKLDLEENNEQILKTSFSEIERCSRTVDKEKIQKLVNNNPNTSLFIKPISFNYTSTVSLLWGSNPNVLNSFKLYDKPISYGCVLETPFYLHGTLNDGEMIIGVNDSTQIECDKYRNDEDLDSIFIKSNLLESAGQLHFKEFTDIINSTQLICTYGLSLGATDSNYWEVIKKKLLTSDSILIIYHYDHNYTNEHISLTSRCIKKVKETFYKNSKTAAEEKEKIDQKIIVEINHILFKK